MRIDGPQITGSFSLNGDGLPDLDVLATTSSLNTYTSSIDTTMGHVMTATHSLNTFTSSASSRLSTIESTTGSLNSFSNSINSYTSSNDSTNTTQNSRLNSIEGATGSYATTGSNTFNGNLTVTGFIEAQELRTTYISSSILYRSGSTKFGDELGDTHSFTGSLSVSGSISVPGSGLVSGSSQISYVGLSNIPSGLISGSSQLPSGTVSGSVQVDVMSTTNIARLATTGSNVFSGTISASNLSGTNTGDQTLAGLGGIGGSGTNGRVPKWTSSTALGDSVITDNGTNVRVTNPFLTDSRLGVGVAGGDQTYASIFIGGAITTGTTQYALLCDPQLAGTDNYAVFANARIKANTAVTNTFGVYIPSAEKLSGASIVNNYALYIANQTAGSTTNYSIYSSGGRNYFGDKVSIGSNTFFTVAQFLVNGGLNANSSAIAQFNGFIRMKDQLIIHNDANTGLESYLQCTAANEITTLNLKTTNLYASGNLVTIGNWTTATTLQFHSTNNSVGRINFYDGNDTEGVYIRNIGETHGGNLRFGARWDDDEDKVYFNLRQSSAGAAYDARFGLNVDPTETFHISSHGTTASAPSLGWPVYNAELDTNARRFRFETKGNGGVATAGQGGTVAIILGQYYDSRVLITAEGNGGSSPGDQGQGRGKDLMLKAGTADNTVGYKGGRLYLNGGMGYSSTYNANVGTIFMQSLTGGGVVNIGTITGEVRTLNVAYGIGVRANLTGTEQEIFNVGNTGSGVNDGYMRLLDNGTVKVLIAANNSRGGDTYFNGGGNVAIGTDVASYKLHVNGTAYATGAAGALSDLRHKKNIIPTLKGINELMRLNPVEFEWNEDMVTDSGMSGVHLGFIAQEIMNILPNTVLTEPNSENTLGLKYNEFIPLLVKSFQELKIENDQLKETLIRNNIT